MLRKYLIAGYVLELDFDSDAELEERLIEYKIDSPGDADIRVKIRRTDIDINVRKNDIIKLSDIAYFYSDPDKDVLFYYDNNISKTIAGIEFSKDYRDVNVVLYDLKKMHDVSDITFMYNILGTVMHYFVQMHNGFVFHSSSVCYNGSGLAFSAKSGTGKSTHTKLWIDNFEGSFILNDDTPIITLGKDDIFYLCGTPWAGTTGINRNVTVPLKALVFLERGIENSIVKMSPPDAMGLFFEGIKSPLTDNMLSNVLDTLNKLFMRVPVYKLKCNMDPEAAFVARDEIFKGSPLGAMLAGGKRLSPTESKMR